MQHVTSQSGAAAGGIWPIRGRLCITHCMRGCCDNHQQNNVLIRGPATRSLNNSSDLARASHRRRCGPIVTALTRCGGKYRVQELCPLISVFALHPPPLSLSLRWRDTESTRADKMTECVAAHLAPCHGYHHHHHHPGIDQGRDRWDTGWGNNVKRGRLSECCKHTHCLLMRYSPGDCTIWWNIMLCTVNITRKWKWDIFLSFIFIPFSGYLFDPT